MEKHNTSLSIAASIVILFIGFLIWTEYAKAPKVDPGVLESASQYAQVPTDAFGKKVAEVDKSNIIAGKTNNNNNIMNATFQTNKGNFTIELYKDRTPNTVANFVKLASEGFYDNVKFHRVIKDFMIQGGDPLTKDDAQMARWGTGGPGYKFEDEISPDNRNDAGTISMANAGPNTNGSQFFINANDNNFLDTKHTVFGKVIKGMEVIEAINAVETDGSDRPVEPVVINSITLQ